MKRTLGVLLAAAAFVVSIRTATAGELVLGYTVDGDKSGDRLGHGVCVVGDINRDGFDDFVAGAYYGSGSRPGYARAFSGKDGKVLYTWKGDYNYDGFGVSANGAGDVNADGYADVIVGAYLADPNGSDSGMARVFSGKDGSTLYTFKGNSSGDRMGLTANGAGDVNGDGYDDLVVGAYLDDSNGTDSGTVYVYSGKDGQMLHLWKGNSSGDNYGVYVAGVGDIDKDGYDDVAVGAHYDDPNGSNSGSVEVYSGKTGSRLYRWTGDSSDDRFGRCVEGAGDVNADGYLDVIVGAFYDDKNGSNSGTVYVFSGKNGNTLHTWYGDSSDDRLGVHVKGVGDVNGDGYDDVAAGAYCDDHTGGSNCGSARVFSGKDGSILYKWYGTSTNEYLGRFISGGGDLNGDGMYDIIVSAYCDDHGGTDTGRVYVYLSPSPTGTLTIEDGAEATNKSTVDLALAWQKAPTGGDVSDMRLRNVGEPWGGWVTVSGTASYTLPAGDGVKAIQAQFRDDEGATSAPAEDTIFLDQTDPTGTMLINIGLPSTARRQVGLQLTFSDAGTGVDFMRFRNEGEAWSAWRVADETTDWTLSGGGGTKQVDAQLKDGAGNLSEVVSDTIEYLADLVAPVVDSLRVNEGAPYVLSGVPIDLEVYARDNVGGAGEDAFKVSFDGGKTWSDWYTLDYGPVVEVDAPETSGLVTALVVVRDKAFNESEEYEIAFFVLGGGMPSLGAGAKCMGGIDRAEDVDAFSLTLVEDDLLSVKAKAKSAVKGKTFDLDVDLLGPDGETVVEGRFPVDAAKPGIAGFTVPASGLYTFIVRRNQYSDSGQGTYKAAVKVKQAKANKKGKGEFTGTEIPFEAASGSTLKASLKGDGLDPAGVTLVGPEGEVAVAAGGKTGKVKVGPVVLDQGTGTYVLRFAAAVTVSAKWSVKLPKIKGTVTE